MSRLAQSTDLGNAIQLGGEFSVVPGLRELMLDASVGMADALAQLRNLPGVVYAEPNYKVQIAATPNDPRFSELWGLHNEGQTGGLPDADIDMIEGGSFTTGGGHTIVAVIDTGVDYTHSDLANNMWVNTGEIAGDGEDNDGNGYIDDIYGYDFVNGDGDPRDDHNHGTHVAGTIAAEGNNGVGVTGVAWDAQIMALKFLDNTGNGTVADAIDALDYAVANGATISNNSWGWNGDASQALYDAIERAKDADHIFLAAAGNGNFSGWVKTMKPTRSIRPAMIQPTSLRSPLRTIRTPGDLLQLRSDQRRPCRTGRQYP